MAEDIENFEELYNNSLKEVNIEKTVTGKVIAINSKDEIIVDIGYKADGIIPKAEFSFDETENPREVFKVGDTITADVLKMNDGIGNVLLSYKKVKLREARKQFREKVKKEEIFEQPINEITDKGFITEYQGIRIFIPLSLSGIMRNENIEDYKGKTIRFKIIELDEKNRKIIGSVKIVMEAEKEKRLQEFWNEAEVGKEYEGTVTSISTYGAFVDLGEVQGLLHISEMAWGRNAVPNELLQVGQKIKVSIIELDKENRRIKLTYNEKGPNPWEKAEQIYHVNDVVKVKVVKFMPFGVFVELEEGIEGLVHISQITEKRISKPEEELKIGQHVNAKMIEMDIENKKIELSIKELEGTSNEYKEEM